MEGISDSNHQERVRKLYADTGFRSAIRSGRRCRALPFVTALRCFEQKQHLHTSVVFNIPNHTEKDRVRSQS
jgi:hypothetical protein